MLNTDTDTGILENTQEVHIEKYLNCGAIYTQYLNSHLHSCSVYESPFVRKNFILIQNTTWEYKNSSISRELSPTWTLETAIIT